jgi:hypothetical protein
MPFAISPPRPIQARSRPPASSDRIYLEAWNRGCSRAEKKVVIADGAEWIWNLAEQHFPGAVQIVDLFHARQRLWEVARLLHPGESPRQKQWILRHQPKFDGGNIEKLVRFLRGINASTPRATPIGARRSCRPESISSPSIGIHLVSWLRSGPRSEVWR